MQLYFSPTSPFARKVRVALIEKGLLDGMALNPVDPWASPEALLAVNPLSQVPTLVLDDGTPLTNSDTILGWLERNYPRPPLLPSDETDRTRVEAVCALAQGLIECVVDVVLERRKPDVQQGQAMIDRRLATVDRVVQAIDARFDRGDDRFQMDGVGVACALSYLDLRLLDHDWRTHAPQLARWHAEACRRASMRETAPPPA